MVFGFCPAGFTSKVDLTIGNRGVVLGLVLFKNEFDRMS